MVMYTKGGKIVLVLNIVVMTVIYITITLEFVWRLNFKFCIVWFIYIGYYSIFYQTITGFRNINIEAKIVKQKTTNL